MIGLDTNVVVRLLVQDDTAQLRRVRKAISQHCSQVDPGFINAIVLVEVIWVLGSVYKYSRDQIASAIETLLQVKELAVQSPNEVWEALHLYRETKVGFADLYLAAINHEAGCTATLTFDKKAARLDVFQTV